MTAKKDWSQTLADKTGTGAAKLVRGSGKIARGAVVKGLSLGLGFINALTREFEEGKKNEEDKD